MARLLTLALTLVLAFALFYAGAVTPPPKPANAPADQFSAGRAMADIAVIARVPHPMGSPANAQVRDYLVGRMTALGLAPRVFAGEGQDFRRFGDVTRLGLGEAEDVIGVIPGRDPAKPAVALMAHYDSVDGSPGAADDAVGVASILEIARILIAKGPPARDVLIIATDGEERGLLGAEAFFSVDPAAKHIGFVMNLEARGGGGRAAMFETGADNGAAIDLYVRTAEAPAGNALTGFVYKLLPNDTDYSVARKRGVFGLNYAFLGRQFDYHAPSSTVAALDQGSLQHIGAQALPTALALAAAADLPPRRADVSYANVVGDLIVVYPAWGGWIVLAVCAVLLLVTVFRLRRANQLDGFDLLQGFGTGVFLLAAGALVLHLVRHATGVGFGWIEGRALLARFPVFEVAMALGALATVMLTTALLARGRSRLWVAGAALVAGAAGSLFGGADMPGLVLGGVTAALGLALFGRKAKTGTAWIGLLEVLLLAAVGLQITAPTIGYILSWPLLAGMTAAALTGGGGRQARVGWVASVGIMAVALAWVGSLMHGLMQGLDVPEPHGLIVLLGAAVIWPLAAPRAPAPVAAPEDTVQPAPQTDFRAINLAVGAAILALALGLSLWLCATSPWTSRHPEHVEPTLVAEASGGTFWRASEFAPNDWVRAELAVDGGKVARRAFPDGGKLWAAPARPFAYAAPDFTLTRLPDGSVRLHAPPGDLEFSLTPSAAVANVRVDGRPQAILAKPGAKTVMSAMKRTGGLDIDFTPSGPGSVDIRYAQWFPWPVDAPALPPMPATMMGWDRSGQMAVVGQTRLTW